MRPVPGMHRKGRLPGHPPPLVSGGVFLFFPLVYSGMQKQNGLIRLCLESINRLKAKPNQKLIQVLFSVERTLLPPAGASPTPPGGPEAPKAPEALHTHPLPQTPNPC